MTYSIKLSNDGGDHDITEAVQVIYDALHASMDFGSGFLDEEEIYQMRRIARLAGFQPFSYVTDRCTCGHERVKHYTSYGCQGLGYLVAVQQPTCECPGFDLALEESKLTGEVP